MVPSPVLCQLSPQKCHTSHTRNFQLHSSPFESTEKQQGRL